MSIAKTVQIHKCDNCGKEEEWNDSWYHKTYFHTSGGPGPWDELVTVCSAECRDAYDIKRKKFRKKWDARRHILDAHGAALGDVKMLLTCSKDE